MKALLLVLFLTSCSKAAATKDQLFEPVPITVKGELEQPSWQVVQLWVNEAGKVCGNRGFPIGPEIYHIEPNVELSNPKPKGITYTVSGEAKCGEH